MPLVLLRLDERLIHGQVVVGWGSQLRPDRYLVVDDDLAASEWEQELYALGAGQSEALFFTIEEARARLAEWSDDALRSVLLVRDVPALARLAEGGLLRGSAVNLGGVHHGPGRRQILTYLHLTDEDVTTLAALEADGAELSAQNLPDAAKVPLRSLKGM